MLVVYNICAGWRERWCQDKGGFTVMGKPSGRRSRKEERWWQEMIIGGMRSYKAERWWQEIFNLMCVIGGGCWGVEEYYYVFNNVLKQQ